MCRKLISILACFLVCASSIWCAADCDADGHKYVNYKCVNCGEVSPLVYFLQEEDLFISDEYDEWGDPTGNSYVCVNASVAKYTDSRGSSHDLKLQMKIKPYDKTIEFTIMASEPQTLQYRINNRFDDGERFVGSTTRVETPEYLNVVVVTEYFYYDIVFAMFHSDVIRFLLSSSNGNNFDFSFEYDPILLSRLLEMCGEDICLTAQDDAISTSSIIDSFRFKDTCLTNVVISDSATSIESSAFSGCTSLKSVTIPDSVTFIGKNAFAFCSSLKSVTIPDSVTTIAFNAFSGCSSLKNVIIPDSVTVIGENAFTRCTSLESVTIPDSVESIYDYAFSDCTSLKSVIIPDSVTTIDIDAFSGCSSLKTVIIRGTPQSEGSQRIRDCIGDDVVYSYVER